MTRISRQLADADARFGCGAGGRGRGRLSRDGAEGVWEDGLKLDDPAALAGAIEAAGLDAKALLAAAQTDPIKRRLVDNTAAAVERGVFGLPAFFVGGEMFFGKERLVQVEEAVEAAAPHERQAV